MSAGWSWYIILFSIVNILACLWLLWWTAKRRPGQKAASSMETTGHEWDGIREYNSPLPKWWLNLFYLTIVFAFVYLAIYPGLGNWIGTQGWTSVAQHDADAAAADAKLAAVFGAYAGVSPDQLRQDAEAQKLGASVFSHNCVTCHGADAKGAKGFPDLTDADWLWGGDPETVLATILDGRQAAMPALAAVIGEDNIPAVAVYVQSLSGISTDSGLAAAGKVQFQTICAACHGPEGKGNPLLGAPNLTDKVWLYGSDFATISETIRNGRNGKMPAHRALIGEDRARLVAAWVLARGPTTEE